MLVRAVHGRQRTLRVALRELDHRLAHTGQPILQHADARLLGLDGCLVVAHLAQQVVQAAGVEWQRCVGPAVHVLGRVEERRLRHVR